MPSYREAGFPQLAITNWSGFMVPAATPEPVMQAMQRAFADAMASAEVKARLAQLDMHAETLTGAAAAKRASIVAKAERSEPGQEDLARELRRRIAAVPGAVDVRVQQPARSA